MRHCSAQRCHYLAQAVPVLIPVIASALAALDSAPHQPGRSQLLLHAQYLQTMTKVKVQYKV